MASFAALALAGCGIYSLAAYKVRRRAREIVVRKIYGARKRDITALLSREFAALVLAGTAVGIPFAWVAGRIDLGGFVEKARPTRTVARTSVLVLLCF